MKRGRWPPNRRPPNVTGVVMSLSRTFILFVPLAPLTFGASKEIVELQRDVAMLQDQVQKMQAALNDKLTSMQTVVQQTWDSVNNTNRTMAVMQDRFNDAMKQQQASVSAPVASVGQKLDQMAEDFRAVRESVLDMNTRMGKLDAKMADLQNLINTMQRPAAPPPGGGGSPGDIGMTTAQAPSGPPAGMQAGATYTNAYRDYMGK